MSNKERWLAVDTSTATMAGAIMQGDELLASVQTESERNHSIHIMTNIEAMLANSGLKINEIDGIATGIGPGSYTGVRVAVTAAKTLAWASGKPLVGISSLAALAISGILAEAQASGASGVNKALAVAAILQANKLQQAQSSGQEIGEQHAQQQEDRQAKLLVLPIMDARRGQVYTAAFELGTEEQQVCHRLSRDHIVLMNEWCEHWSNQLADLSLRGVTTIAFFGDCMLHKSTINELRLAAAKYQINVLAAPHMMKGEALAQLAQGEWLDEKVMPNTQHDLVPNYAQLTEAEVKQNEKERGAKEA